LILPSFLAKSTNVRFADTNLAIKKPWPRYAISAEIGTALNAYALEKDIILEQKRVVHSVIAFAPNAMINF
jgi:hypothetical protein